MNDGRPHDERAALEQGIRESLGLLTTIVSDVSGALERLRQLRLEEAHALPEHALLIHEGPNGRPEVLR